MDYPPPSFLPNSLLLISLLLLIKWKALTLPYFKNYGATFQVHTLCCRAAIFRGNRSRTPSYLPFSDTSYNMPALVHMLSVGGA